MSRHRKNLLTLLAASISHRVVVASIFAVSATCCQASSSTDNRLAPVAIEESELRRRITDILRKIKSLRVSYQIAYEGETVSGDVTQLQFYRCQVVAKAPSSLRHESAKSYCGDQWANAILKQLSIVSGASNYIVDPTNRVIAVKVWDPANGLPGSLRGEPFFLATGIWPLPGVTSPMPFGHGHFLTDIADVKQFHLQPTLLRENSTWCHVMQSQDGSDRVWLDATRGGSIIKRVITSRESGLPVAEFNASGHSEIYDGIWMPKAFSFTSYRGDSPFESERTKVARHVTALVESIRLNDAILSEFHYEPESGAIRIDADNPAAAPLEFFEGGVEHLDALSRAIALYMGVSARAAKKSPFTLSRSGLASAILISVIFSALVLKFRSVNHIDEM